MPVESVESATVTCFAFSLANILAGRIWKFCRNLEDRRSKRHFLMPISNSSSILWMVFEVQSMWSHSSPSDRIRLIWRNDFLLARSPGAGLLPHLTKQDVPRNKMSFCGKKRYRKESVWRSLRTIDHVCFWQHFMWQGILWGDLYATGYRVWRSLPHIPVTYLFECPLPPIQSKSRSSALCLPVNQNGATLRKNIIWIKVLHCLKCCWWYNKDNLKDTKGSSWLSF